MTGYGKAEYQENGISLTVEIKTVNNRNFDFNAKMPRLFLGFEDKIRKTVNKYVSRGRIDLFINFTDTREKPVNISVDVEKAKAYYLAGQEIAKATGLESDLTVSSLMRFPEVVTDTTLNNVDELEEIIINTLILALERLNSMRKAEGEKLVSDMLNRIETIKELRNKVIERAPLVSKEYKEKLTEKITKALESVEIDQSRLLNEVAFFIDKANIDEELTRLGSHVTQFCEIVKKQGEGKRLDFLMQEFNRETNTICSKSNDLTITSLGLALKNEIEKIREQVQNLE